ncbi:hypothetical protein Back2_16230 [Nocardioides baekrokdamisoli]|uniref:Uncharacterized protein n=1 Tax=Nocardioides baekrokdamisoli TaxID=1804624 RepID=A0A3G9IG89_9ACTN|nr:hypothetical protein [Nocardioides baekrokdamisoli]BBH17336.1 hypothetical protein Back2_16230 [Nocardioides baekrokdamisoli]
MSTRVRTLALAFVSALLILPLSSADAAVGTSLSLTDPALPGDTSAESFNFDTGTEVPPPPASTVMDLRAASITADRAARTMTISITTNAPINSTNCVRTGGRSCVVLVAFRGVNTTTGRLNSYSYELGFQPLLGVSAQHPRVESLSSSFTRNFTVTKVSTWGNHFVVTVSTANFPDARLRPYLTVDSAHGSAAGAVSTLRTYYLNAAHDLGAFVDVNGQTALPDLVVR